MDFEALKSGKFWSGLVKYFKRCWLIYMLESESHRLLRLSWLLYIYMQLSPAAASSVAAVAGAAAAAGNWMYSPTSFLLFFLQEEMNSNVI